MSVNEEEINQTTLKLKQLGLSTEQIQELDNYTNEFIKNYLVYGQFPAPNNGCTQGECNKSEGRMVSINGKLKK